MKPTTKTAPAGRVKAAPVADELVPDPLVAQEFNITLMTLWRWTKDPELGFPPPVKIRKRNFRSRKKLDTFKQRLMRDALAQRTRPRSRVGAGAEAGA